MTLQDEMLRYRVTHNLTQEDLAKLVGTTRVTINRAENGKSVAKTTEMRIKMLIESNK